MDIKLLSILIIALVYFPYSFTQVVDITKRVEYRAPRLIQNSETLEFTTIAIDQQQNGYVYVGGRNRLFQLDLSLNQYVNPISTGPVANNIVCKCESGDFTDNLNKLLLIDHGNSRIVVCGSVEQGICELRQQGNLRYVLRQLSNESISASRYHVAASGNLSTVGFLASDSLGREYLYVGSSKTVEDEKVLDDRSATSFFTIAKRSLPQDTFSIDMFSNEGSIIGLKYYLGIKMKYKNYAENLFRINFILGFATDTTGYFVLTHPSKDGPPYTSDSDDTYISQLCLEDENADLDSYLELPLACSWQGIRYRKAVSARVAKVGTLLYNQLRLQSTDGSSNPSDVIFIAFSHADPNRGSAFCMFTVHEIERQFVQLATDCMKKSSGYIPQHIPWIDQTEVKCNRGNFDVQSPACTRANDGMWKDVVRHLYGNVYEKNAVFQMTDTVITAIEIARTASNEHTVGILGTQNGKLLKVRLDSDVMGSPQVFKYEQMIVDPETKPSLHPGSKDLLSIKSIHLAFGEDIERKRMYVMTPSVIVGLPVFNCSQYKTCSECLSSRDPFCGWCTLENQCSSSSRCEMSSSSNYRFLIGEENCPRIVSESPPVLTASHSQETIHLKGYSIPVMSGNQYSCSFGDFYTYRISGMTDSDSASVGIVCVSPPRHKIPKFSREKGHLTVPLKLEYQAGNDLIEIARTDFSFYNCTAYNTCFSCVRTQFNCSWCPYDNKCTHQFTTICPQSNVKESDKCPQIAADNELHVAEGAPQDLILRMHQLPDRWDSFTCELDLNDGQDPQIYTAVRTGSSITCRRVVSSLPAGVRSVKAALKVTTIGTGPKIELDNPSNVRVELYRCELAATGSCGLCLESPPDWKCGWCRDRNKCTLEDGCRDSSWLEAGASSFCPNPQITKFSPQSAPFGGNSTIINLKGVNFSPNEKMLVTIGYIRCAIRGSSCCEAECTASASKPSVDFISLCISSNGIQCLQGSEYTTKTEQTFSFVDPVISSFDPSRALIGWPTDVTIRGEHLDAGNMVAIGVDGRSCSFIKRTSTYIKCRLGCSSSKRKRRDVTASVLRKLSRSSRSARPGFVMVSFDNVERTSQTGTFSFQNAVNISSIRPHNTILNGGLPLYVTGLNLHLIQNPQMSVHFQNRQFNSDCTIQNSTTLKCPSPNLARSNWNGYRSYVDVAITSKHGGNDCPKVWSNKKITYESNPVLDAFDSDQNTKIYREEPIYITGSRLCPEALFCDPSSTRVLITNEDLQLDCNVTRVDMDQITCLPPPADLGTYMVQVHIGGFSQEIGQLKYEELQQIPVGTIVGIVVVVLIVIGIVVAILFVRYRFRANAKDKELKRMELELNAMESKVAKVCKEGFAELQTMMGDMDNFAGGTCIPYLPYRVYLLRVLFPDPESFQRISELLLDQTDVRGQNPRVKMSLSGFNRLLHNKTFLLNLIRTFENQQTFYAKDRGKVAALILVILHDRLEYATEILEKLLADLIRKNMESRNNPKLLFRRSESVAEKMLSHWFSILLYRFVSECAGEPLYTLYRAIKQQVSKGPVDAFTNDARYSLSEDKLLRRHSIEYSVVSLRVINYLVSRERSEFNVKVLSCDSISQAKRKILDVAFTNFPRSDTPSIDAIDIELHPGRLLLRDEDSTSRVENDWTRVNTISHYKLKNDDEIHLMPKRDVSNFNSSTMTSMSKVSGVRRNGSSARLIPTPDSSNSSLPRHKQASRSGTPVQAQDESKLFHLVMPSDQDQAEGTTDRANKMVSEIYLTTLLTTKGTLQKYVDDLFETIFSVVQRGHDLPLAVKHLFDFLDYQASMYSVTDSDIVYQWKSNCLPLRFWVNLIKNPEFVFDIEKPPIVDCYLSVIAQAFMDSCSTTEYKLGKDSPSNKLLYAKEIKDYRQWVSKYYADVKTKPRLNRKDLSAFLLEESSLHSQDFNTEGALTMLYEYVDRYNEALMTALEDDPDARRQGLSDHLANFRTSLNGRA